MAAKKRIPKLVAGDKAPDFTGDIMHNGEVIKLSAWKRQSAYGELLSLSISNWPPNKGTGQPKPQQQYPRPVQQDDALARGMLQPFQAFVSSVGHAATCLAAGRACTVTSFRVLTCSCHRPFFRADPVLSGPAV